MRQKQLSRLELGQSAQILRNPRPRNLAWHYVTGKNFQPYLSNVYKKVVISLHLTFAPGKSGGVKPACLPRLPANWMLRPASPAVTILA
jgi:hypothetical protein